MNKIERFLMADHSHNSYSNCLKIFLNQRYHENGISIATRDRYFYNLYSLPFAQIDKITRAEVETFIAQRRLAVAVDTLRTQVADIKEFFRWCKENAHHSQNPAVGLKSIKRQRRRRQSKAVPEISVIQLMTKLSEYLRGEPERGHEPFLYRNLFGVLEINPRQGIWYDSAKRALRDLLAITILYESGMRVGELVNLSSKHMDDIAAVNRKVYMLTVWGKTGYRDRFITHKSIELWNIWQQIRPDGNKTNAIVGWKKGREAKNITSNGISHMLVRRCDEFSIDTFRAYALRHAKVQRSRRLAGLEVARELVDHSAIDSTENYSNIEEDELLQAAYATGLKIDLWS